MSAKTKIRFTPSDSMPVYNSDEVSFSGRVLIADVTEDKASYLLKEFPDNFNVAKRGTMPRENKLAQPKADNPRETLLGSLEIETKTVQILSAGNINTVGDVEEFNILDVEGVGPATAKKVEAAVSAYLASQDAGSGSKD